MVGIVVDVGDLGFSDDRVFSYGGGLVEAVSFEEGRSACRAESGCVFVAWNPARAQATLCGGKPIPVAIQHLDAVVAIVCGHRSGGRIHGACQQRCRCVARAYYSRASMRGILMPTREVSSVNCSRPLVSLARRLSTWASAFGIACRVHDAIAVLTNYQAGGGAIVPARWALR